MMKKSLDFASWYLAILTIFAWGCDGPVAPEVVDGTPGNGTAGSGAGPDGSSGSGPGGGGGPTDPLEMLPGVDVPLGSPPDGCLGGSAGGAVSLTLSTTVPSVRLEATGGVLYANGVACTDSNAGQLSIASLVSLHVEGTVDDNAAILDLASGDWSTLLDIPESISLGLGYGENSFLVFGTSGPDFLRHGMRGGDPVIDLVGDGRINVLAGGVTELGVSLGDGDDKLDDLSALLTARAAEAAEAAEAAGEEAPAPEDAPPAVLPLSVRLVATGGPGNDWILGGSAGDQFDGGSGDDVISGLLGDDTLSTLDADDGADTFNGGLGYDDISYVLRSANLVINICASEAVVGCVDGECDCARMSGEPGEDDRLINVEDITGGEGDDTIYGSEASDSLSGSIGDDSIFGLGGSDVLYGQGGDDIFDGGQDGDYCDARPGEQSSACEL